MAAGPWVFTDIGRTCLLDGTFDVDSDTFNCALFLDTSDLGAGSTTYPATDEHANQGAPGYETGGQLTTLSLTGTTTVKVAFTDVSWTATGGSIVAKFAAIYEVGGNILQYCLLDAGGADVTVTVGNILKIACNAAGEFTLA